MFGIVGKAIGLVVDLARGNTTLKKMGENFDVRPLLKDLLDKVDFKELGGSLLSKVSNATAPVKSVPNVKEISGIKSMYLSKTTTEELRKNLDINKKLIEEVPDPYLEEYREESLSLIDNLSDKLEKYEESFNILTQERHFNFLPWNSVNYDKIWGVRKTMKRLLHEMNLLLEGYNGKGNKFDEIEEELRKKNMETRERAERALAKSMFVGAFMTVRERFKLWTKETLGKENFENMTPSYVNRAWLDLWQLSNKDEKLGTAMRLTLGIFDTKDCPTNQIPEFDTVKDQPGPKMCSRLAKEHLDTLDENKTPFEVCGLKAEPPFMGDYAEEILGCVKKTQKELNDVINLGSKKSGNSETLEKSVGNLDINLKTLLGDQYKNYVKNFEKQKEVLKTAVNKDLINQMYTLHSQVEKEYKKINQYREKYFLGSKAKDAPGEKEKFYGFSQLKVNVTSTKTGDDKNYEIASKHDELQKIYGEALGNSTSVNHVSLYIRKAEKFLKACKVWNKERTDYEKWLNDRKTIAKEWLRKAKEHFQYLKSQNSLNDEALKNLKKEYGKLPWFAYTFVKDFKTNVEKAEKFCKLKIKEDGNLVDSEGNSLNS